MTVPIFCGEATRLRVRIDVHSLWADVEFVSGCCEVNAADCCNYCLRCSSSERREVSAWWCVRRWVISSCLAEMRLNIPRVCRLSIVWQSNIILVVLWTLTHPSCSLSKNAGLWLFWIFHRVCGALRCNHSLSRALVTESFHPQSHTGTFKVSERWRNTKLQQQGFKKAKTHAQLPTGHAEVATAAGWSSRLDALWGYADVGTLQLH